MAERRMFAKTIIDSDAFLDMPLSAQALYFHLSMRADDDGFINNPKKIQRMVGASDDDCKLLILKRFIITFESGVIVIKHWKIHNYIRNDRKKETNYTKEMALLTEKKNGSYSLKSETSVLELEEETQETKRQKAYRESSLPYSFEYKIKRAFWGCKCPICSAKMQEDIEDGIVTHNRIPTIQHNVPISKGGKHELGNISVICKECNITLQDTETEALNADEVIKKWDEICMTDKCLSSDGQVSVNRQHSIGKVSEELEEDKDIKKTAKRFSPPTLEEVKAYCIERNNNVDAEHFIDYYTSNGWLVGKNKMKDWKAAVRTWERNGFSGKKAKAEKSSDIDLSSFNV